MSGPTELLRGGASVRIDPAGAPARPAPDTAGNGEAHSGLFRPRLIEFGEMRRETSVSVRPEVREEIVVARSVDRRVERVEETVRRTEVEVENLPRRGGEEDPESA